MTNHIPCKPPLRVGIAGPIGSGKTLLIHELSKRFSPTYTLAVALVESTGGSLWSLCDDSAITPGLSKDAVFLQQQGIVPCERIKSVASITDSVELQELCGLELIFVEHGGNDLAAAFASEQLDVIVYVVDVTAGKEVICRGGSGLVHSDLLIMNKADLAPYTGVSLAELVQEVRQQRGERPFFLSALQRGDGLDEIANWLESYLRLPVEERPVREAMSALIEEQWFWRYKMSRGAHTHFETIRSCKPQSAAPMAAAPLVFSDEGQVAWDQMWSDFCDLAAVGGPPHRGTLLEPIAPLEIEHDPESYAQVVAEIERGIQLVTDLATVRSPIPGWVGVECEDETMATWLQQAILAENVSVRRTGSRLYLPAGPTFELKAEIKNVITAIAKTHHYWQVHLLRRDNEVLLATIDLDRTEGSYVRSI